MLRNSLLCLALLALALPVVACSTGGCGGGMSLGGQGVGLTLPSIDFMAAQPTVPGPRMRVQTQTTLIPQGTVQNTTRYAAPQQFVQQQSVDPCGGEPYTAPIQYAPLR